MATWLSSQRAIPAPIACLCLVAAIASCGDDPKTASGSSGVAGAESTHFGDPATLAAGAATAGEWHQVARSDLSRSRSCSYTSASARSGSQRGSLIHEDRTHFLIRSFIPVATTSSDGEAAATEFEVVRAVDGKELRILLPTVLGTASSVAIFPVDRLDELADVRPGHPLHRFRFEALNPVLMAQALVDACSDVAKLNEESDALRLTAKLQAEDLRRLGVIDLNDREANFKLEVELMEETGSFLGLKVLGADSGAIRFQLQFADLPPDSRLHEEAFTLDIPAAYDIVDLSQQLSR